MPIIDGQKGPVAHALDWWGRSLASLFPQSLRSAFTLKVTNTITLTTQALIFGDYPIDAIAATKVINDINKGGSLDLVLDADLAIGVDTNLKLDANGVLDDRDLALEISTKTPFQKSQVYVAYSASNPVQLFLVPRTKIDDAMTQLHEFALTPHGVYIAPHDQKLIFDVAISASEDVNGPKMNPWAVTAFLAACAILSPALQGMTELSTAQSELEGVVAELKISNLSTQPTDYKALEITEQRAQQLTKVQLLDHLTKAFPDGSALSFLRVEDNLVHVEGRALDVPLVIVQLEKQTFIKSVEYTAPVVHDAAQNSDRFQLRLTLVRMTLVEGAIQ
jgi:hypothetical protein